MSKDRLSFEEALSDSWSDGSSGFGLREVPLSSKTILFCGLGILLIGVLVMGRIIVIASDHSEYQLRSVLNLSDRKEIAPPRGLIYDGRGKVLAENKPSFLLLLDVKQLSGNPTMEDETSRAL